MNPYRLSALGAIVGLVAFSCVIFSEPFHEPNLFRLGTVLIGFGGGLFSVGTLTAAMNLEANDALEHFGSRGLVIGAWGAVVATATGISMALGGALRDLVSGLAINGDIGTALVNPATGYSFVYHLELYLLLVTLIAIGPLVRASSRSTPLGNASVSKFGLAEFPS